MNKYKLITFVSLLFVVAILPLYAWQEPARMAHAQTELQREFVAEASLMYVANCAVCHGAAGEGIGAMPAINMPGLQKADYEMLFKTVSRGRYETAMTGWHRDEGGIYNDYQIDELVALIRYGNWEQVGELAASQGLIPPTLPVPEVEEALLLNLVALDPNGAQWADGLQLFAQNCTVCHGVQGEGSDLSVPLRSTEIESRDAAELTRLIGAGVPGTMMVGWDNVLTEKEITDIVAFLQNWGTIAAAGLEMTPPAPIEIDLDDPEAVLALGKRIFDTTCAACHGENGSGGTGPVLNSQQILTRKTDQALITTIINGGHRPNSTMPAFGDRMTMVEIEAVTTYLRAWEPTAPLVQNPRGTAQGGGPPWLRTESGESGAGGGQGGQGQGGQSQGGQGQGGPPWRDTAVPNAGDSTAGQGNVALPSSAAADLYRGQVMAIAGNKLTLLSEQGLQLEAMLGPPWFWDENGIPLRPGDEVEMEGFPGDGHMELNWLTNHTTGAHINLRTPTGQPVWGQGETQ